MKTDFTPELISELKSFLVERMVDNMSTKDLVAYVTDDLDEFYGKMTDSQFMIEAQNYWDDPLIFDEVVGDIEDYMNCPFSLNRRENESTAD